MRFFKRKTETKSEVDDKDYMQEPSINLFVEKFIEEYKRIVDHMYAGLLKSNPEALRLYNPQNVKVYHVKLDRNYFIENEYLIFVYCPNANLEIESHTLLESKFYKYDTPTFEKSEKDILVEAIEELSSKDIVTSTEIGHNNFIPTPTGEFPGMYYRTNHALESDVRNFHSHNNHPQDYYAKRAARYAYSELDLNPIINKVNDEDFSYQIDQAIAAYDYSLYLASCATLGVCLETICKLLLTRNGIRIKDSDSTLLDKLTVKLRENQLISYKMKGRIDVCYKVRNLAAHTSPGKIVKSDCHFILNTISEIVEEHF